MNKINLAVQIGQDRRGRGEKELEKVGEGISVSPEVYEHQRSSLREAVRSYCFCWGGRSLQKGQGRARHLEGDPVPRAELWLRVTLCPVLLKRPRV